MSHDYPMSGTRPRRPRGPRPAARSAAFNFERGVQCHAQHVRSLRVLDGEANFSEAFSGWSSIARVPGSSGSSGNVSGLPRWSTTRASA